MQTSRAAVLSILLALSSHAAAADVKVRDPIPASLPLVLSDGSRLDLDNIGDKVVVLYFYEQACPSCAKKVPERNAWLEKYKGQPVRFVAIGAGDTVGEVQSYIAKVKLRLPTIADPLSVLEKSWGFEISLKNIYKTRVISQGKLAGYNVDDEFFERTMQGAKWKYDREGCDPALLPVLDKFEWGELDAGSRLLKQARKSSKKPLAESANKFYEAIKSEAQTWLDEGLAAMENDPVKAYDLLSNVSVVASDDPIAKTADEKLRTLKTNDAVKNELAARKMLDQLATAMSRAKPGQEKEISAFAKSISKKYPETPTAKRVELVSAEW